MNNASWKRQILLVRNETVTFLYTFTIHFHTTNSIGKDVLKWSSGFDLIEEFDSFFISESQCSSQTDREKPGFTQIPK